MWLVWWYSDDVERRVYDYDDYTMMQRWDDSDDDTMTRWYDDETYGMSYDSDELAAVALHKLRSTSREWPNKLASYYIPELVFPLRKEIQPLQPVGYIISAPVVLSFFIEVASLFCRVCGWGGGYYIFVRVHYFFHNDS